MANGDEYLISHGPWKGWTHRSIELASASGVGILVPKDAISRILVGYHEITCEGEAGDYSFKEEDETSPATTGKTVKGPHPIVTGGTAVLLAGDGSEGIRTINKNKDLQVNRGAAATVKGEICYRYEQVIE